MGSSMRFVIERSFTQTNPLYVTYNHIITESLNAFPHSLAGMSRNGLFVSCENIVSNCWYAGQRHDCCQDAVLQIDEDGPCFDLGVSWPIESYRIGILTEKCEPLA